jgi:hypothetical protein
VPRPRAGSSWPSGSPLTVTHRHRPGNVAHVEEDLRRPLGQFVQLERAGEPGDDPTRDVDGNDHAQSSLIAQMLILSGVAHRVTRPIGVEQLGLQPLDSPNGRSGFRSDHDGLSGDTSIKVNVLTNLPAQRRSTYGDRTVCGASQAARAGPARAFAAGCRRMMSVRFRPAADGAHRAEAGEAGGSNGPHRGPEVSSDNFQQRAMPPYPCPRCPPFRPPDTTSFILCPSGVV